MMGRRKRVYSCMDIGELEDMIHSSAVEMSRVTLDPIDNIEAILDEMVKNAFADDSGMVSRAETSECGHYVLSSEMMDDHSSIKHSRVKFRFLVLVNEREWEEPDGTVHLVEKA